MSGIIAFALSHWRWLGGAAAALVVAGLAWGHFHHDAEAAAQRDAARAAEHAARGEAQMWAQAYRDEQRAVTLQNARIARMGQEATAWQQRAQAATAQAHRASLTAQASAAAFLAVRPQGASECERAADVARRIREDLQ
jgi:hypothetical protein